jgi:hypothetical protein
VSSIPTTIASLYADTGTAVIVSSLSIESVVLIFGESASNSYAVSTPDCTHGALPES